MFPDIMSFSQVYLKSLEKLTTARRPRNRLVCVYRRINGSIAFDFWYGKENEINVMLYRVYTGLYSVQISIYSYKTVYTRMSAYILIQDCIYAYEHCISGYIRIHTRTYRYKTVYTRTNAVYLGTSPYIRV